MGFVFNIVAAANAADKVIVTSAVHAYDEHIHVIVAEKNRYSFVFRAVKGPVL